jgi:hypothetical protein
VLFHGLHDVGQRRVRRRGLHVRGHDLAYAHGVCAGVLAGELARTGQQFHPAAAVFFGAEFAAAQEVAFGDNAHKRPLGVGDGQPADASFEHQSHRRGHGGFGAHGGRGHGHHIAGFHGVLTRWRP